MFPSPIGRWKVLGQRKQPGLIANEKPAKNGIWNRPAGLPAAKKLQVPSGVKKFSGNLLLFRMFIKTKSKKAFKCLIWRKNITFV